jgi:hypothetical protein
MRSREMRRQILSVMIQLSVLPFFGQNQFSFHPPLDIPMYLSGNFGEIRADHFHSGIDIKTQGATGHHVFAIDKGYVSRIKVQANGYGKSIYLTHPGGYTSVYGHLDSYREDIEKYVKKIQYQRRSHQLDIYIDPGTFQVDKGDFIAYSGNSGGSSGPHLHFEIRTSGNQHPTNVLKYGFDISDNRSPKFHTLFLYCTGGTGHVNGAREKRSFDLVIDHGTYMVPWGTRLEAGGEIGIGVEVFDYLDGASNRCGIYALELYVDEELTYSLVMNEFSFSETRYVNAHMDYEEQFSSGKRVHRLYRLPNDRLSIYGHLVNNGVLTVSEHREYPVRVVATDVAGNRSELKFTITGRPGVQVPQAEPDHYVKLMKYNEPGLFENDDVSVEIPANALYEDLEFTYAESEGSEELLTGFYQIHHPSTPVHLPYMLSIKAPEVDPVLRDKLMFVTVQEGEIVSAGGSYEDGAVVASLTGFGSYAITMDTVAPEIIPLNGSFRGDLSGRKTLAFTIRDDLSGVEKYEGYIDNRWALFEYDPKNELLTYRFDEEYLERNRSHELELYVTDSKGNVNLFHTTFTW